MSETDHVQSQLVPGDSHSSCGEVGQSYPLGHFPIRIRTAVQQWGHPLMQLSQHSHFSDFSRWYEGHFYWDCIGLEEEKLNTEKGIIKARHKAEGLLLCKRFFHPGPVWDGWSVHPQNKWVSRLLLQSASVRNKTSPMLFCTGTHLSSVLTMHLQSQIYSRIQM